jgi:membrane dipeptidase
MTLTWTNTNDIGDSSGDATDQKIQHHDGLTPFGREVVAEMNRLGMLVDVSHVADRTFFDAVAASKAPIIASHSSARALTQHARNMTDEMLQAVAKNGGVVMVNFFSAFIDEEYRKAFTAMWPDAVKAVKEAEAKYANDPAMRTRESVRIGKEYAARIPRPKLAALVDHIDHIAKVAGIDHVGIGSDFDGVPSLPEGIDSAADLPKIFAELRKRGYSQRDLDKIASGNILRVMRAAEKLKSNI